MLPTAVVAALAIGLCRLYCGVYFWVMFDTIVDLFSFGVAMLPTGNAALAIASVPLL
jgi:hypothetical protein